MDFCVYLCVFFVCFLYLQLVAASSCNFTRPFISLSSIRKHAMSLDSFDTYVEGQLLSRHYQIYHNSITAINKNINHRALFTKMELDAYKKTTTYNQKPDGKCKRFPSNNLNVHNGKASFYYAKGYKYTVFYSWCPSSYLLMFECDAIEIRSGFKKCPLDKARMSLFKPEDVVGSLDDTPWYLIAKNMYKVTGIQFGCDPFKWDYTYGATDNC